VRLRLALSPVSAFPSRLPEIVVTGSVGTAQLLIGDPDGEIGSSLLVLNASVPADVPAGMQPLGVCARDAETQVRCGSVSVLVTAIAPSGTPAPSAAPSPTLAPGTPSPAPTVEASPAPARSAIGIATGQGLTLRPGIDVTLRFEVSSSAGFGTGDVPAFVLVTGTGQLTPSSVSAMQLGDRWRIDVRALVPPAAALGDHELVVCVTDVGGGLACSSMPIAVERSLLTNQLGFEQPPADAQTRSGDDPGVLVVLPSTTTRSDLASLLALAGLLIGLGATAVRRDASGGRAAHKMLIPSRATRAVTLRLDGRPR
jgi:hypothetical protein